MDALPNRSERQMNDPPLEEDTREPRRWLEKHQAVRHLIHAPIRLIQKQGDPFAVHLLIRSADKLLIDLAKKRGEEPRVDWELYCAVQHHLLGVECPKLLRRFWLLDRPHARALYGLHPVPKTPS